MKLNSVQLAYEMKQRQPAAYELEQPAAYKMQQPRRTAYKMQQQAANG